MYSHTPKGRGLDIKTLEAGLKQIDEVAKRLDKGMVPLGTSSQSVEDIMKGLGGRKSTGTN